MSHRMGRKQRRRGFSKGTPEQGVPGAGPEGDDVKVPIEVEGDAPERKAADEAPERGLGSKGEAKAAAGEKAAKADSHPHPRPSDEDDEQAKIEAAIRAGEKAADEDFKGDADKLRKERDELAKKLADLGDELEKAKAAASDSADRLTRLQADWDNFRRRTATERLAERDRATEKLVKNLLPVIDDMERAIAHATSANDGDENLKQFTDGVDAVHTKLVGVLDKEGVEVINPKDEAFDPLESQAVGRVEDAEAYADTVRDVYQPGYRMGGKVLRPAMVTVTYGGKKRPAPEAEGDKPADEAKGDARDARDAKKAAADEADGAGDASDE